MYDSKTDFEGKKTPNHSPKPRTEHSFTCAMWLTFLDKEDATILF